MQAAVLPAKVPDAAPIPLALASPTAATAWTSLALVFGAACITFGILWDISWHATIGRDTFWTPAHMLLYLGGTLGGCVSGWLACQATLLQRERLRATTVGIWWARAPLGAWLCIWGATAMLVSAPFDDWWHNAYGLDVKILSPPHAVLAIGMDGVVTGALVLVTAERNRLMSAGNAASGSWVVVAAYGIRLAIASVLLTELSWPNLQHTAAFVKASSIIYPLFLVAVARHAPVRWAATKVALLYMLVIGTMVWLLPLFPAEPKLAPVYSHVTHMTPPAFPLLLVLPAIALDLLFAALRKRTHWAWNVVRVAAAAVIFLAVFVPTQWAFSKFLISPAADNAFFAGSRFFGYMAGEGPFRHRFWDADTNPIQPATFAVAGVIALASSAVGLAAGTFLARVRR